MPGRTPGGHRLYSKRDIEIIKWLISKQGEGLSISRAVDLWNELIEAGQDPLPTPIQEVVSLTSANLDAVRKAWLEACLVFDESTAEQVLNQAFATHPLETVCIEVLQRGLHEMGEMWYRNEATVQQEHFTSALAQRRLDALIAAAPAPTRPYSVLIGCTPGEQHVFVPLLLTLLLRRRGLKVIYLGANVPVQRFNETLQSVKPHLVVLSAQQLQTANALREAAAYLNANGGRVSYGGRIFNLIPELRKRIPAHFLGKSLQEAIQSVETLLTSDIQIEGIEAVHEDEKQLSLSFNRHRPMIDMYALTETNKIGMSIEFSTIAVQQLGNNMRSALSMGNIEAINQEMDWIEGMLHEYNQDGESLNNFLSAYAKSVDSAMGNDGKPISSWLRAQINGN
jgi:methanogenic corrinoid protein MtbC1